MLQLSDAVLVCEGWMEGWQVLIEVGHSSRPTVPAPAKLSCERDPEVHVGTFRPVGPRFHCGCQVR